jgi:VIT1/CCC1 family predicted Fe2+/Mn2+ transporter
MNTRRLVLAASLVLIGVVVVLTLYVIIQKGLDVLVIVSLLVLALLGFGVIGALTSPPSDE